jgi:hypothetical protein
MWIVGLVKGLFLTAKMFPDVVLLGGGLLHSHRYETCNSICVLVTWVGTGCELKEENGFC